MSNWELLELVAPCYLLELLRFHDELRQPPALKLPPVNSASDSSELKIGEQLIDQLTARFDPRKYEDTYQEVLGVSSSKNWQAKPSGTERNYARPPPSSTSCRKLKASLKQVETGQRRAQKQAA
jgi:non-homologous end joining protein Ku